MSCSVRAGSSVPSDSHPSSVGQPSSSTFATSKSIAAFAACTYELAPAVCVLVNNAGMALGSDYVQDATVDAWRSAWETNVLGAVMVTRAFIPLLRAADGGHIVTIGSAVGTTTYPGGSAYTSTKYAIRAFMETLRLELNGEPIRVTEIAPGFVRSEFFESRYSGDKAKAQEVYEGLTPLSPEDVAECVAFAVTRPRHVNVDYLLVKPLAQAAPHLINREGKV
jgi:NADP-dependent 3-hydroxy acid dehydrogenase YdfG